MLVDLFTAGLVLLLLVCNGLGSVTVEFIGVGV